MPVIIIPFSSDDIIIEDGSSITTTSIYDSLWKTLPSVENISYTSVNSNPDDNINFVVPFVITSPRKIKEREPSFGKYRQWISTFKIDPIVWSEAAPANIYPKSRDTFIIEGITWQVTDDVDGTQIGSLYRLKSNYLEFAGQLTDIVSILQATASGSSTGARQVSFTILDSNIMAAIEPRNQRIKEQWGSLTSPELLDCYLDNDVSSANDPSVVKVGALVQDQNGIMYDIIEVLDRDRLDLKTHLVIEKKL